MRSTWQYLIINGFDAPIFKKRPLIFVTETIKPYFCRGEMAERSNAAVLKTVDCQRSGGSNPSLSARKNQMPPKGAFFVERAMKVYFQK